jgi:hypothetical protein
MGLGIAQHQRSLSLKNQTLVVFREIAGKSACKNWCRIEE